MKSRCKTFLHLSLRYTKIVLIMNTNPDEIAGVPLALLATSTHAGAGASHTLHPIPCTLHPTPCSLHPTHCTLLPTHYTLHTQHFTLHTSHYTLRPTHYTLHPTPYTLHLNPTHWAAIDGLEACASTVVLVTGASGDVGGHIARCLIDKGYSVNP